MNLIQELKRFKESIFGMNETITGEWVSYEQSKNFLLTLYSEIRILKEENSLLQKELNKTEFKFNECVKYSANRNRQLEFERDGFKLLSMILIIVYIISMIFFVVF